MSQSPDSPVAVISQPMPGDATAPTVFTLRRDGVEVQVTDAGASLYRVRTPDGQGGIDDIVCAPRQAEHFVANPAYMGATIGRFANRIAGARITVNGTAYPLTVNEGPNQLHGGECWHRHRWEAAITEHATDPSVKFSYRSPAGEGGFPGTVSAHVRYTLKARGELQIAFFAESDAPTVVNMTNHAYFNLNGAYYQGLRGQHAQLFASRMTETGAGNLPTGRILEVAGTPFDLRRPLDLAAVLDDLPDALKETRGYDHNFVYKTENTQQIVDMAQISSQVTGRTLRISSSQPGMQFYTGNFMGGQPGPEPGRTYDNYQAFCCEPQHFPDTPNQPDFPQCNVTPEQPYRQTIVYRFGTL